MADPIIGPQRADIWDVVSTSSEAILVAGLTLSGFFIMMIRGLRSLAMMNLQRSYMHYPRKSVRSVDQYWAVIILAYRPYQFRFVSI